MAPAPTAITGTRPLHGGDAVERRRRAAAARRACSRRPLDTRIVAAVSDRDRAAVMTAMPDWVRTWSAGLEHGQLTPSVEVTIVAAVADRATKVPRRHDRAMPSRAGAPVRTARPAVSGRLAEARPESTN